MNEQRLIDANALKEKAVWAEGYGGWNDMVVVVSDIDNAPTIEPPVVSGWWIKTTFWDYCSVCNTNFDALLSISKYPHCPHCAAKMDAKEDAQ